jgi:hypothetical protein
MCILNFESYNKLQYFSNEWQKETVSFADVISDGKAKHKLFVYHESMILFSTHKPGC